MDNNLISSKDVFNLFGDLNNLYYYLENDKLNKFYNNCISFIENKKMDINQQNENGDTLLHLAFYYSSKELILKLLNLGADPYLLNNKNKNAFQNTKEYGFAYTFIKDFKKSIFFNNEFHKKVVNFHPNFKFHLALQLSDSIIFHDQNTIENVISILKKSGLYSVKNFLDIIENSSFINKKSKLDFINFLNSLDDKKNNSQILLILIKNNFNFYDKLNFNLNLENNSQFKSIVKLVFYNYENKKSLEKVFEYIVSDIIKYNFDVYSMTGVNKKYLSLYEKHLYEKELIYRTDNYSKFKI